MRLLPAKLSDNHTLVEPIVKKSIVILFLLILPQSIYADSRPDHFKGKTSETWEQALHNLSEYNQKLDDILKKDLSKQDMVEIHKLSYTLENALERIKHEVAQMAEVLEDIHIASEQLDSNVIKEKGPQYLARSKVLLKD